jgi:hypothetical protein
VKLKKNLPGFGIILQQRRILNNILSLEALMYSGKTIDLYAVQ